MNKKLKVDYVCKWCGYKFSQKVGYAGDKHSAVSSQVICPRCKNFIPTWEEDKKHG